MDTHDHRQIVVGVDGSLSSHAALDWAADIAGRWGGSCEIVAVTVSPRQQVPWEWVIASGPAVTVSPRQQVPWGWVIASASPSP